MKRKNRIFRLFFIITLGVIAIIISIGYKSEKMVAKKNNKYMQTIIGEDLQNAEIEKLYFEEVGNKTKEEVEEVWQSNVYKGETIKNQAGEIIKEDKRIIKQYELEGNNENTKNYIEYSVLKEHLEDDNTYTLELTIPNLTIEMGNYNDIRINLDYMVSESTYNDVLYMYSFELFVEDEDERIYGPFHIDENYVNGMYKWTKSARYGRGFNIITENIITEETKNKTINKIIIKPFGNLPSSEVMETATDWRKATAFTLASIDIKGYKSGTYEKEDFKQEKTIDVDTTIYNVIQKLYKLATIKWTPDRDFSAFYWGVSGNTYKYKEGLTFYGLPYTQANKPNLETFKSKLDISSSPYIYHVPTYANSDEVNPYEFLGADCAASMYYPLAENVNLNSRFTSLSAIWDRATTTLLGNLEIKGSDTKSDDVVRKIQKEYDEKIENEELDKNEQIMENKAKQILDQRLRTNTSNIAFNKACDHIIYRNDAYPVNVSLPTGENLSLWVENLSINTNKNDIIEFKIYYELDENYGGDPQLAPEFKLSFSDGTELDLKYEKRTDEFGVHEITYSQKLNASKTITGIKFLPYGEWKEGNKIRNRIFRLKDFSVNINNEEKYKFGISELQAYFDVCANTEKIDDYYYLNDVLTEYFKSTVSSGVYTLVYGENSKDNLVSKIMADQKIYKGYEELLLGDVIASDSNSGDGVHIRMITGNTHTEKIDLYDNKGNKYEFIDPVNSYMIKTDIWSIAVSTDYLHRNHYGQDGTTYSDRIEGRKVVDENGRAIDGGVLKLVAEEDVLNDIGADFSGLANKNLNYYINDKTTFAEQNYKNYLPIRINAFETGKVEEPYALLKNYDISNNDLRGTISTNYNITSINFKIKNKDGEIVLNEEEYPNNTNSIETIDNSGNITYSVSTLKYGVNTSRIYSLYYNLTQETRNAIIEELARNEFYEFIITVKTAGKDIEVLNEKLKPGLILSNEEISKTSGFLGSTEKNENITREKINSIHICKATDTIDIEINQAQDFWKVGEGWNPQVNKKFDIRAYYKELENGKYDIYIKPYSSWLAAKVIANEDSSYLFANLTSCEMIIGLENLDTSNVLNMSYMFYNLGYSTMERFDVSKLNTENVENMSYMFAYPYVSSGEGTIKEINFGENFNTSNVTTMEGMFKELGRYSLEKLDISSFETNKVENMSQMFFGCGVNEMTELNLGNNFNTENVINMQEMFKGTGRLKMAKLDLGDKFNTINVENMDRMFENCGSIKMKVLNLGKSFKKIANNHTDIFNNCGANNSIICIANEIYVNSTNCKLNENTLDTLTLDAGSKAKFHNRMNFKVIWKNYNGEVLEIDENLEYGTIPTYNGLEPQRPNEETNIYRFKGWIPEVQAVDSDVEYIAEFEYAQLIIDLGEYTEKVVGEEIYLIGIQPKTKIKDLGVNIRNGEMKIIKDEDVIENQELLIGTGYKAIITGETETKTYTLVVKGDCTSDGECNISDLWQVNKHRLGKVHLLGSYLLAADVNDDGNTDIKDIWKINKFRLGKITQI